ncbi:SHD1 domain-containing protein [Roseiconus lacunae]|uniref:SHD1 domain-containing protein n=1 Tax=Roseiconus lacunae TaxID=2605694 RepID=UPI001E399560|nr:SHD1 domain-containing protein [Roseiconus lacunae]MCD0462833.1 hypothetical protein [Roseiconus lacunae]
MRLQFRWLFSLALVTLPAIASARQWSDQSGRFQVEGQLVASDEDKVVVRTEEQGLLVLRIDQLSKADRSYLAEKGSKSQKTDDTSESDDALTPAKPAVDTTWRLTDGETVTGRLVGFGKQTLVLKRRDSDVVVNDVALEDLPKAYAKILPEAIEAIDRVEIEDPADLEDHLIDLGTGPLEYEVSGVQLALPEGGMITLPINILAGPDASAVRPGFERWLAAQNEAVEEDERSQSSQFERLMLDSYSRMSDRSVATTGNLDSTAMTRARLMDLQLQAATAGVTDVWQVGLIPRVSYRYPTTVVVYAENSRGARIAASAKYPGWRIGPIRKLSY